MRTLCLILVGVGVGWAASGVDWTRDAVGQDTSPGDSPAHDSTPKNAGISPGNPKEILGAAQAALEATEINYKHGKAEVEDIYR